MVWKDAEWLPRVTPVFEVQDKGNVLEALVRLKHAYDNWGARLFLVVTGEKDRTRIKKLLVPYFSGAFHEIGPVTTLLSPDEVDNLHSTLSRFRDFLGGSWLARGSRGVMMRIVVEILNGSVDYITADEPCDVLVIVRTSWRNKSFQTTRPAMPASGMPRETRRGGGVLRVCGFLSLAEGPNVACLSSCRLPPS